MVRTRIPQALYDELAEIAARDDRSISYLVRQSVVALVAHDHGGRALAERSSADA
jgi:predicted transcriptional regulator